MQTAQQEIEQKKKMEMEASEVKETPSPNKSGGQKVNWITSKTLLILKTLHSLTECIQSTQFR